ncbi:E4 ubiquitin-protein ligase UFD2 [Ceratobasidium sp. AG-Ba]|nr:E4 ubiquitin-protein ligase UFD2 [Ceratobasidium sp. AG-Ba]
MPSGKGYSYSGSGTNSQGNHYCSRDYGSSAPNQNSYHYSNTDGSYYYSNPNGSTSEAGPRTIQARAAEAGPRATVPALTSSSRAVPNVAVNVGMMTGIQDSNDSNLTSPKYTQPARELRV